MSYQRSLDSFLTSTDGAGQLMAHARLLLKLAHIYECVAPAHLGQASRVANYKSGIVVIHADNGALAVKLKQMAPSLATEFLKRGVECNGLQVKVQARENPRQSSTSTQKPLSAGTGRTLTELAGSLPASPLREALEHLVAHALIRE